MYHVYLHRKEAGCYVLELGGEIVSVQRGLETTSESCTVCIYTARRRAVMYWSWVGRLLVCNEGKRLLVSHVPFVSTSQGGGLLCAGAGWEDCKCAGRVGDYK